MNKKVLSLTLLGLLIFSGCSNLADIKELGNNLCKELGHEQLTDYKGKLNLDSEFNSIFEVEGKYYYRTNIMLECDNTIIYRVISYYDPKKQTPNWGFGGRESLGKTATHKCEEEDKWGFCKGIITTYATGEEELLII